MDYSNQEVQKDVLNYSITILSDEIILLSYIKCENIREERNNYTSIEIESATYSQRLYEVFKNKELVKLIKKEVVNFRIDNHTIIDREFIYNSYFKIDEFHTCSNIDGVPTYSITFQSV